MPKRKSKTQSLLSFKPRATTRSLKRSRSKSSKRVDNEKRKPLLLHEHGKLVTEKPSITFTVLTDDKPDDTKIKHCNGVIKI